MINVGDTILSNRLNEEVTVKSIETQYIVLGGRETSIVYLEVEDQSGQTQQLLPTNVTEL
jgi:hypothetical protein